MRSKLQISNCPLTRFCAGHQVDGKGTVKKAAQEELNFNK
jgi:hypothetical protein